MEKEAEEIVLILSCRDLPGAECLGGTAARLGIQRGQEVCGDAPATSEEIVFQVPLRVKRKTGGEMDFFGPYVQGKAGERFIYLSWGERQGETWEMVKRAKLPLSAIAPRLLREAIARGKPIEAVVQMTDARGNPLCATIPESGLKWQF